MIIPLSHENMHGRRWPWITIGIIAINFIVFLFTNGPMERQSVEMTETEFHILILNSLYPDAPITPDARELVQAFKIDHPDIFQQMGDANRKEYLDEWDERVHSEGFTADDANTEMSELCIQLIRTQSASIMWNYAFHPVHPFLRTYITSQFLHGGWMHIIFNMWFLWLAGSILEDLWGRVIYPVFYFVAGVFACAVHGAIFPHSLVPALGASGAIAGLMGAFLYRFPKVKIRLGWIWWFRMLKFSVPAYIILPLWLGLQVLSGVIARAYHVESGVGYWAHIGGFAFGALGAWLLQISGVEHMADKAVEAKVSWTADPLIVRAGESLAANKPDLAIADLQQHVAQQPESIDGWDMLLRAQTRAQDVEGQRNSLSTLCRLRVVAGEMDDASRDYESFKNLGGSGIHRGTWLELCRFHERNQRWETAAEEYEKLGETYPTSRVGVAATISAAEIYLKQLHRSDVAETLFEAAQASKAPHADLDEQIAAGLAACAAAAPQPAGHGSYGQ